MNRLFAAPIVAFSLFLPAAAMAEDGAINAFACEPMPQDRRFEVVLLDDADPMLKVRDALLEAMRDNGMTADPGAPLKLTLEVGLTREPPQRKPRDLGSIRDATGEDLEVRMNVWSNRQDSIVGGRRDDTLTEARDDVRVMISINAKSDGHCLWQGEATHDTDGRDHWALAEKIVPQLVRRIGRTVDRVLLDIE